MARASKRFHSRHSDVEINLGAMVDMFTLLLTFLLMSFGSSVLEVENSDGMRIPSSIATTEPNELLQVLVSSKGIYVDKKLIVELENSNLKAESIDANDKNFIRPLFEALDKEAKKSQEISEKNSSLKFKGEIIIQADENSSYALLKNVMYTSMLAGYADIKLGAMGK